MSETLGTPPPVLDLLVEVFDDLRDHFLDRLVAGLGILLVMMPLTMLGLVLIYVPMIGGAMLGVIAENELLGVVGMMLGLLLGIALLVVLSACLIAPLQASLGRAILRNLDDGSDLTITAAFTSPFEDVLKVVGTSLILSTLTFMGGLMMYIPALMVAWATGFAMPGVIVHRLGPVAAIQQSVEHALREPLWHLGFAAVTLGATMVLAYVPVIGPAVMYPFLLGFQLRAYIAVFGREPL